MRFCKLSSQSHRVTKAYGALGAKDITSITSWSSTPCLSTRSTEILTQDKEKQMHYNDCSEAINGSIKSICFDNL